MKTQLLEDFDESGSAPDGQQARGNGHAAAADTGAGRPPHPAVWQRARHADEPAPSLAQAPPDTARTEPLRVRPHGFAPQPAVLPGGGDPDWLAAHLARDAALNERSASRGRWTRRLAAWGGAGVLLALLAGGGLWLYDQSQVDGALVVVANTNPAPAAAAARPVTGRDVAGLPAAAPVSSGVATQAESPTPAPVAGIAAGADAVGGMAGASTAAGDAESVPVDPPVRSAPEPGPRSVAAVNLAQPEATRAAPRRARSHVRKHPKADASAAIQDGEPTYHQRREETLMQCRAHGYDERQCLQRGCEMTRFGFACKG